MCKISETFLSSILKGFDNTYYLVSINPVFDELSYGIKFVTYSIWNHSATPLAKGYAQSGMCIFCAVLFLSNKVCLFLLYSIFNKFLY
jgi:hypothetical protein